MAGKSGRERKTINTKLIKNKLRTAFIWITRWYSLTTEDHIHMLLDMSGWELFPPSFYRTHTEEEIRAAEDAASRELDELLRRLEEMREEDGKIENISG